MFKPGDLVCQAQNIFADRQVGGTLMVVVQTWGKPQARVDVLFSGNIRTFHEGELEIYRPRK